VRLRNHKIAIKLQENKGFLSHDAMRRATGTHRIVVIFQKLKPESD
jgi:hypothetical protein